MSKVTVDLAPKKVDTELSRKRKKSFNGRGRVCYCSHIKRIPGNVEEALSMAKTAMRLGPHIPSWYFAILGLTYYMTQHYEESPSAYKQLLGQSQLGEIASV